MLHRIHRILTAKALTSCEGVNVQRLIVGQAPRLAFLHMMESDNSSGSHRLVGALAEEQDPLHRARLPSVQVEILIPPSDLPAGSE